MNKLMIRVAISTIICGLSVFSAVAFGQTSQNAPRTPCRQDDAPARPTLKRRLPMPDDSAPKEDRSAPRSDEAVNCGPDGASQSPKEESRVEIGFEGLVDIDESDLRKELREHRVQLPKDPFLDSDIVEKASAAVKGFLAARGYRRAVVNTRVEQTAADSKMLVFVVNQGLRPKIEDYRFEGNRVFSTHELTETIRQCTSQNGRSYYDPEVFEYCRHRVDNQMRSRGYMQARLEDPKIEETPDGVLITSPVSEGVLFRVGKIEFEGAKLFSPAELLSTSPLKTGEIANGDLICKWLYDDLKARYGKLGYIQYSQDVTPEYAVDPRTGEGRVNLNISIDEGSQFTLRRLSFDGGGIAPQQLLPLMRIHEGEVYSQELFEKSIDALNDTGLFETIDKDKDADFRTDNEEGQIDIVIKLRRKTD